MRRAGLDALIVTGPENIFWLSGRQTAGYFAFQALVLPADGAPTLLVRQLEVPGAMANTWLTDIVAYQDGEDPAEVLLALLRRHGVARVAIERAGFFLSPRFMDHLEGRRGTPFLDGSDLIPGLRLIKSPMEQAAVRLAARHAEVAMTAGLAACSAGQTENSVAAAMLSAAVLDGSEAMAMEPLVSSGPRSGLPHMTWRRRPLALGDPLFLELAGCHDRYHAALMRTVWIGTPPPDAQRMMDAALRALDAALAALRPGQPCAAPHEAAQAVIDEAGYTAAFRKRIGYSMGLAFAPDWGEGAILDLFTGRSEVLAPGMVFHLPATLRVPGLWTVGASETVIMTETGAEVLSSLPRTIQER
ncbi:aminopeptidase P family protein [Roseospira marina]|uniref:Aminopeptidase P family protein n=2 Tax=Roseospira marina TaxID=140057 RepID=A0A5M6IHJ0_9PROT|nr:aminopeptidase P family protein [Roseospira marina]